MFQSTFLSYILKLNISHLRIGYGTILYYGQQMHNYLTNYHTATCSDTFVILRKPVSNTLPSYTSISNEEVGNKIYD
jgi:hypothetical protein